MTFHQAVERTAAGLFLLALLACSAAKPAMTPHQGSAVKPGQTSSDVPASLLR